MKSISELDLEFMRQALALAQQGEFSAHPNPLVGCILVRDQQIVGQGLHWQAGLPHAECNALAQAQEKAQGATCYVTLEPCTHYGRTGPCVKVLIEAGVKRVVIATLDPNPLVQGKGVKVLQEAGIEVTVGLLEYEARAMNIGFFSRMLRQKPFVCAKIATSLDGRIAMAHGESQWITCEASRHQGQVWRARSGAVLTGSGTVIKDDCRLTVKEDRAYFQQPLRVIVDTHLRTPPTAAIFQQPGKTAVIISDKVSALQQQNWLKQITAEVECVVLPLHQNHIDLAALLAWLGECQINQVLVEAGPMLTGALLQQGLIDQLLIFMAPKFLGSQALGMVNLPGIERLCDHLPGNFTSIEQIGSDLQIIVQLSSFMKRQV